MFRKPRRLRRIIGYAGAAAAICARHDGVSRRERECVQQYAAVCGSFFGSFFSIFLIEYSSEERGSLLNRLFARLDLREYWYLRRAGFSLKSVLGVTSDFDSLKSVFLLNKFS